MDKEMDEEIDEHDYEMMKCQMLRRRMHKICQVTSLQFQHFVNSVHTASSSSLAEDRTLRHIRWRSYEPPITCLKNMAF